MEFREYVMSCILNNVNMEIEMEHLPSITFTDICTLIHWVYISDCKLKFSDAVRSYLNHPMFELINCVHMKNTENSEELAILLYLVDNNFGGRQYCISVFDINKKPYKMSDAFIKEAKKYGIHNYDIFHRIVCSYNIQETPDTTQASISFREYMTVPKSARG